MRIPGLAVIFDMDGLLLDSEPIWHEAEAELARSWGARWTEEDATGCTGKGIPETARRLAVAANRPFDPRADPDTLVDRFLGLAHRVQPKRGARELVAALTLAKAPLALGSSSPRRVIERMLGAVSLRDPFSIVVSGDDVARVKPEPDIFLGCARGLGVAPGDCLVLEDSLAGVTAGKRAGMRVYAVPEAPAPAFAELADAVFEDLVAVQAALAG